MENKQLLRYGMVGGGPDGNIGEKHRQAIAMSGDAVPAAGCFSRSMEKNRDMANMLGIAPERCYRNYQEMAQKESERDDPIDFVVVVTPNASHYEICKAFLEHGIHVVCDKPFTVTVEQAEELARLARERQRQVMVTYTYTGHHMFRRAKAMIASGQIGKVRKIVAEYPQCWLGDEQCYSSKQAQWRRDPKQSGQAHCLADLCTHIENAVFTLTGLRAVRVLAKISGVVDSATTDDDDMIMVEYENGATGMYWAAQHAYGQDNDLYIRIYGSEGALFWSLQTPLLVEWAGKDATRSTICADPQDSSAIERYGILSRPGETGWVEAMCNLYHDYIACLKDERIGECCPNAVDGVAGVRFVQACLESDRGGNVWMMI